MWLLKGGELGQTGKTMTFFSQIMWCCRKG